MICGHIYNPIKGTIYDLLDPNEQECQLFAFYWLLRKLQSIKKRDYIARIEDFNSHRCFNKDKGYMKQRFTKSISIAHSQTGQGVVMPFITPYQHAQKLVGKINDES